MRRCYGHYFIALHVYKNLKTTSGLSILIDGVISLPDATSYDKYHFKVSFTFYKLTAIGTFLFEERVGCFSNPAPEQAQDFIDHLREYFKYLQPLMYNLPVYKLYKTKTWKKFEHHADRVFELGRHFINKVCN